MSEMQTPAELGRRRARDSRIEAVEVGELPSVSQREFVPTPYVSTAWEIIGEPVKERDFVPLEVSIIQNEAAIADPMFEVFDTGFKNDEETYLHGLGAKSDQDRELADAAELTGAQLEEIEAIWQAKVAEAHEAGFTEGATEAESKIADRYDQLVGKLQSVTDAIYQQWAGLAARLEQQAVDLSLQVSRKILATTAEVKPEYIVSIIREALANLGAAKPVRIRVSLDDFEFLSVIGLPMELSEKELGITYVADENVKSGCIVETDFGEIDLVLDRMWEEVKDQIFGGME